MPLPPVLRCAARLADLGLDGWRQIPFWRSGGHSLVPVWGRARWVADGRALSGEVFRDAAEGERGRRFGRYDGRAGRGAAGWLAYTGGMSDGKEEREERERRRAEEKPWEREDRVERGEPEWEPEYGE